MRRWTRPFRTPAAAFLIFLAAGVGACGQPPAGGPAGGGFPPASVTAMILAPRTVAVPYEFAGRLEGSREVEVRARVSGILLQRTYEEGGPVRQGQTLFVIDPAPFRALVQEAEASLAEATARSHRAEREMRRLEPLLAARAASQRDFDAAISEAEQARATVLSATARLDRARLDLGYTRVVAPISGLSSRAEKSEGSLVEPGDNSLLTRISQVRPMWVRFSAPDRTMWTLRRGLADGTLRALSADRLEVDLVLADGTRHAERGRVNFSDSVIDPSTGSIGLRAEFPNADGRLVPGQFVRAQLLGVERPNALLVPQRAVQQGAEGRFVFVVGADDRAEARPVVVGDWLGSDWVIESGLAAGDRVIVDGAVKVQPGAQVAVSGVEPAATPAATEPRANG